MKLTDILFNRYTPYKRPILIVFSIISFLTITIYSYQTYIKPSIKEKDSKNISNANRRTKEADIIFFHTSWCPHCKKALPIWKDFVSTYDQTIINGYTINCINGAAGIDCDDPKSTEIIEKQFLCRSHRNIRVAKREDAGVHALFILAADILQKVMLSHCF